MNAQPPDSHRPARAGRPRCSRCDLPLASCLCAWVRPTANQVPLLLLQHPQEVHQAKGSARLLRLSLARCRCAPGEHVDDAALADMLGGGDERQGPSDGLQPVLLYPDDGTAAAPNAPRPAALPWPPPGRWRLVLLDGTWRQSRQLLRQHPRLQALPRWALPAPPASRYAIRRAHRPGQLATLEAACLALGALEADTARYAPLLAAFGGWVASVAARRPPAGQPADPP